MVRAPDLKSVGRGFKSRSDRYLAIGPVVRKDYESIANKAKPNGLLTHGPFGIHTGLIVLVSPN